MFNIPFILSSKEPAARRLVVGEKDLLLQCQLFAARAVVVEIEQ